MELALVFECGVPYFVSRGHISVILAERIVEFVEDSGAAETERYAALEIARRLSRCFPTHHAQSSVVNIYRVCFGLTGDLSRWFRANAS